MITLTVERTDSANPLTTPRLVSPISFPVISLNLNPPRSFTRGSLL